LKQLTYVNAAGAELVLTNSAPFLLQNFSENGNVNIYSSKGMNQDGLTYLGNTLDLKDISLEFIIVATSEEELITYRNRVSRILHPRLGEGYLIYKDDVKERKIKCIVNKLPSFSKWDGIVANYKLNVGLISLTANNPYWTDLLESKEEIVQWIPDLEFPLELSASGIELAHKEPTVIVNVVNEGDVECGMRVEFKARAQVTNPSIANTKTGEFIRINKVMAEGEVLTITTYFGSKKVESSLNGVISNAFNAIDLDSTFLQLDVGDNLLMCAADTGIDDLVITIYYNPQYSGV
jgi:hypothetical protein